MTADNKKYAESATGDLREHCAPIRSAEGAVAAVDLCVCGCETLHLHLGSLTLRLSEQTLSELLETLGQAIAALAIHKRQGDPESLLSSLRHMVPGKA